MVVQSFYGPFRICSSCDVRSRADDSLPSIILLQPFHRRGGDHLFNRLHFQLKIECETQTAHPAVEGSVGLCMYVPEGQSYPATVL